METKDPNSIQYASYNPRILSAHDASSLDASMSTFGDIATITINEQTNRYVTGHQRMRTLQKRFPGQVSIQITRLDQPDEFGTTGTGFVIVEGTNLKFACRTVSWSEATEKTANISANRIEADWNEELLAQLNQEIIQFDNGADLLALTGQTQEEIDRLNQLSNEPEKEASSNDGDSMSFKFTTEQAEVVNEAVSYVLAKHNVTTGNMDIRANAIHYICTDFLDRLHGLQDEQGQEEAYKTE